jgi:hypothetical protein
LRIAGAGIFFIASPVFAAALTLMGTSTPGTLEFQATYLTKDGLLNGNDVYFTSTNTTGALASQFSSVHLLCKPRC